MVEFARDAVAHCTVLDHRRHPLHLCERLVPAHVVVLCELLAPLPSELHGVFAAVVEIDPVPLLLVAYGNDRSLPHVWTLGAKVVGVDLLLRKATADSTPWDLVSVQARKVRCHLLVASRVQGAVGDILQVALLDSAAVHVFLSVFV